MKRLGLALCGSYCCYDMLFSAIEPLRERYDLIPILSERAAETDSRFGTAVENRRILEELTGHSAMTRINECETLAAQPLDALLVAPCTGNTLAKLAHGITDSSVTMAVKAHLRNARPVLLGISTNDGLSGSAENIARLLNRKEIFFVPFRQDAPEKKPYSLQSDFSLLLESVEACLEHRQLQPILR